MSIHTNDKRLDGLAIIFFKRRSKELIWIAAISLGNNALTLVAWKRRMRFYNTRCLGGRSRE